MDLHHLAYISHAAPEHGEGDLQEILAQSRRNNPPLRITGHLQCHGGFFFQVLEGPSASLDGLLTTLVNDPRHSGMRLLYRESLVRRHFANWSMGFGPCLQGVGSETAIARLEGLRDGPAVSARRVLTVFFQLLDAPGH